MSVPFNAAVRGDPNWMRRAHAGVMQPAHVRGNQRSGAASSSSSASRLVNAPRVTRTMHSAPPTMPLSPSFAPLDSRALSVEPRSRVLRRGRDSVTLRILHDDAPLRDVQWTAFTPATDDVRRFNSGNVGEIMDQPLADTRYEVRYQYATRVGQRAMQWHAGWWFVVVRVVADVNPASPLQFTLDRRIVESLDKQQQSELDPDSAEQKVVSFIFCIQNNDKRVLQDILVRLIKPEDCVFDAAASRRALPHAENRIQWDHRQLAPVDDAIGESESEDDDDDESSFVLPVAFALFETLLPGKRLCFAYSVRVDADRADEFMLSRADAQAHGMQPVGLTVN